jgi:hypothetical protein
MTTVHRDGAWDLVEDRLEIEVQQWFWKVNRAQIASVSHYRYFSYQLVTSITQSKHFQLESR